MPRSNGLALTLVIALAAVAACAPGKGVADRIRDAGSDLLVKVEYREGNPIFGRPEIVYVYLGHDTTDADAGEFWCTVVVPAGGADLPKGSIEFFRNDQQAGEQGILEPDPVCPE